MKAPSWATITALTTIVMAGVVACTSANPNLSLIFVGLAVFIFIAG